MAWKDRIGPNEQHENYVCPIAEPPVPVSAFYNQDLGSAMVYYSDDVAGAAAQIGNETSCATYFQPDTYKLIGN